MSTESENQRRIGPFLLDRQLGVGGMGIVYSATYEKNGLKCAVKVLAPDVSENDAVNQRFIRETEILKKLQHPNIIKYYGAGSNRTQRFYAMEMVDGGALDQLLKKEGPFNWERTIEYTIQIARALEHAHNAGIVHRDLKPGNLLISKDGTLKLSDFGIARDTQATALTQAGKTVGTMNYMAPEQISGKYPITKHTDLYALGCVMFEMLTGRVPFQSETQAELLFKHLDEAPPSVREFNQNTPVILAKLIDELLSKEPSDRPFDALAVQVRLEEIKEKLKQQEEKRKAATVGGITTAGKQKTAVHKKKKKKKPTEDQPQVPIYEQTWFLATMLGIILIGISIAIIRTRSESNLYARAAKYMQQEPSQWINAKQDLLTMLQRYPQGEHAAEGQEWLDQIEMNLTENRIATFIKLNKDPTNEAERLYLAAGQYERFGDRFTALEKYEAIPKVIAMTPENRPYLNLARRQAEKIKTNVGADDDRTTFIKKQLEDADSLYAEGKKLQAREKWQAIVRLYGDNSEFEFFTNQATDRLKEVAAGT